jgi:photosystem II stability/assembly factor-like uncharacterized protein
MEGVWRWAQGGTTWTRLDLPGEAQIIYTVAASPTPDRPCLLVSTPGDLLHSEDGGQSWQAVPSDGILAAAFSPAFAQDGQVWAATVSGELLASSDAGRTWTSLPRPLPDDQLVSLDAGAGSLALAILETGAGQIAVWRSGDGGQTWSPWLQQPLRQPTALISLAQRDGHDLVTLGNSCWCFTPDGWQRVLETEDVILRVQQRPDWQAILLLTSTEVRYSTDSREWTAYDEWLAGQTFVDLALPTSAGAEPWSYLLSSSGAFWRRRLFDP